MSRNRSAALPRLAPKETSEQRGLSPRQSQILEMLRAGKVNKEIAAELGIGLGTVKQHVVALFKKLDVRNRAMAVSRGMQMRPVSRPDAVPPLAVEGILEYRPCVVLSVALPESAAEPVGRRMQQALAAYAFDHDALFLARKGHAGDLIFGVQRASEQDLYLALRAARTVVADVVAADASAAGLRGGLTAGLAVASMSRTGGWTGEAIASIAIAQGRELAAAASAGTLLVAPAARELLRVQNPNTPGSAPESLALAAVDSLPWDQGGFEAPPLGREAEIGRIEDWMGRAHRNAGSLFQISGETGMGKSRLCRLAAANIVAAGGRAHHFACRPDGDTSRPYASVTGIGVPVSRLYDCLAEGAGGALIVDDCHLITNDELERLSRRAAAAPGCFVLLTARRFPDSGTRPVDSFRLGRIAQGPTEQLVSAALGRWATPALVEAIVRRAAGVPLFALELAYQRKIDALPLSLRMLVGARMDGLRLDRAVLRRLARARGTWDVQRLAMEMDEPRQAVQAAVAAAQASGVLGGDATGRLHFAHPLLRQAIDLACVE